MPRLYFEIKDVTEDLDLMYLLGSSEFTEYLTKK